jgi:hypothetical protein
MQNRGLEIPLLVFMTVVPAYTIYARLKLKKADGNPFGIGHRVISLIALLVLVPALMILSVEKLLPTDALISLLGTIVGYSLSRLSKDAD